MPGLLCEEGPPLFTIMSRDVITFKENDTVADAVKAMSEKGAGSVVVVNDEGKPIGIFTERDLMKKVCAKGLDPREVKLGEVMTRNPLAARETWTASKALEIMAYYGFRHLPVVDDSGKLIGIVSIKDVVKSIVEEVDVSELSSAD